MGYNPFRWYTQDKYRKKLLKSNVPFVKDKKWRF